MKFNHLPTNIIFATPSCGPTILKHPGIYRVIKEIQRTTIGGSPGDVSEEPVTYEKRKNSWEMSCEVGKATEGLENEL